MLLIATGVIALACWGTGLVFGYLGLFLLSVSCLDLSQQFSGLLLLTSVFLVAPCMARFVGNIISPLLGERVIPSLVSLLAVLFSLAIFADRQIATLFTNIIISKGAFNPASMSGLVAEALYISSLMGASLVLVVALLESPFHWLFSPKNSAAIDWISGLRPLILIIIVMGCASELAEFVSSSPAFSGKALFPSKLP